MHVCGLSKTNTIGYLVWHPMWLRARPGVEAYMWTYSIPYPRWNHRSRAGQRQIVKEPHGSGLGQWGLAQGIGDIKHKVERSAQELR